jgi:perosamine synthetase
MIPFFRQIFTEKMRDAAVHALENERFCLGESVFKFEEAFASYCGSKLACGVSTGTNALKIALLSAGLNKGEQVLTTPMSFIATANSVLFAQGKPVFSDIKRETGLWDYEKLSSNGGVKALLPVHLYGQMCKMDTLKELAEEKNLLLIEDACQAHAATFNGKKAGTFGEAGCFSFYAAKNMTVGGDGGMIVSDNEELIEKAKVFRDCGRLTKYEHSVVGATDRLNTVNAAIGIEQLKHLNEWTEKRRALAKIYRANLPPEILLDLEEGSDPAYHLFVVRTNRKASLEAELKDHEIGFGVHYPIPIHLQPIYKEMFGFKGGEYPESEYFANHILSLPMFPGLKEDEAKFVCEKVNEVYQ